MQATKQMIETGDFVSIRFQDEPRTKKPVGIHWLQVAAVKTFALGDEQAVWAYRLPSALAAWATVLVVFVMGRRFFDRRSVLCAATLAACTLIWLVEAHIAKTDAALLLAVVLAQFALMEIYLADDRAALPFAWVALFWLAIGFGVLIKGPVVIAVVGVTILALSISDKRIAWLRGLRPLIGVTGFFFAVAVLSAAFIVLWDVPLAWYFETNLDTDVRYYLGRVTKIANGGIWYGLAVLGIGICTYIAHNSINSDKKARYLRYARAWTPGCLCLCP